MQSVYLTHLSLKDRYGITAEERLRLIFELHRVAQYVVLRWPCRNFYDPDELLRRRSEHIVQFLLVYLIAAVAHILGEGLMGITVQMAVSTDNLMNAQEKAKDKI
ncbi:MAG: hypothetical protein MUF44_04075 [Hydrogenophaga sp.]|nr:hypothetical protein [Hydrogenophaga sp.]